MNREIKFRALTSGSGIWVIGDLVHLDNETLMASKEHAAGKFIDGHIEIEAVSIYPGSIGQFTGLQDKNGKDIYEGDIVKTDFKKDGSHESIQTVEFYEGSFGSRNKEDHFRIPALFSGRAIEGMNINYYEVIGNIHQNPELLP